MELLPRPNSPFFTEEHNAFRDSLRRFVDKEIEPFATQWDEAETFPRELYKKAGDIGFSAFSFPKNMAASAAMCFT